MTRIPESSREKLNENKEMIKLSIYKNLDEVDVLEDVIAMIEANPDTIAKVGSPLDHLDKIGAMVAVAESAKRHCGTITSHFTPFGEMYEQVGKDLTGVGVVVGTGGPIIHNDDPTELLSHVIYDASQPMSLRPKAPSYYLDTNYIMAAMGLLATEYPEVALRIMKREIQLVG